MSEDQKPLFSQPTPPAPGAHFIDRIENKFLHFFDHVLGGKTFEGVENLATNNSIAALDSASKFDNSDAIIKAEQDVIVACGNFLTNAAIGAAIHGQSIGTNAEATQALNKLFETYEHYHDVVAEILNHGENASKDAGTATKAQASGQVKFTPKVPTPAA